MSCSPEESIGLEGHDTRHLVGLKELVISNPNKPN